MVCQPAALALPPAPAMPPAAVDPALTAQIVRATLLSLITLVVGALATDPASTTAIPTNVRQMTSQVTEVVFFDNGMPLPVALPEAAGRVPACMELDNGSDGADLIIFSQ